MLRFANAAAAEAPGKLTIIHDVQAADTGLPIQLDLEEQDQSEGRQEAARRIAELQRNVAWKFRFASLWVPSKTPCWKASANRTPTRLSSEETIILARVEAYATSLMPLYVTLRSQSCASEVEPRFYFVFRLCSVGAFHCNQHLSETLSSQCLLDELNGMYQLRVTTGF